MNKSTPLSQLTQQSAPEKPSDVLGEDEATIQEVLNQINMQNAGAQQAAIAPQVPQIPPQPQLPLGAGAMPPQPLYQPPMQQYPSAQDLYNMQQGMLAATSASSGMIPQASIGTGTVDMFMTLFADDVKIAALVFGSVIVAHFVPAGSILNRYIAIDKIPYHDVILRAIICALLVVILKKLLFK